MRRPGLAGIDDGLGDPDHEDVARLVVSVGIRTDRRLDDGVCRTPLPDAVITKRLERFAELAEAGLPLFES